MQKRSFLFLQGVSSPFFARLADRLQADGHRVFRINFTGGDLAYWGARPAFSYRASLGRLHDFFERQYRRLGITDQILFGDRRPVHRPAIHLAKQWGIRTHVFEEGYFRPFWVTLERQGVNAHSLLPRDPAWFRETGRHLPDCGDGEPFAAPFWKRAAHDVRYHLASCINPLLFPDYRTHAPCSAPVEYLGYVRRFSTLPLIERRDKAALSRLLGSSTPFFFLPLQLSSDAQIRDHSRFTDMAGVIECVMSSFARHAPDDARLVIKNHPLDTGLDDHRRIVARLERDLGLLGRVTYLESGDLTALLQHARGVVTVNSTVGSLSIGRGCPTITLGDAIYDMPGLTFQGTLDEFWRNSATPDGELFRRFRNTVIHTTQVNGGFYSAAGIALAVENCQRTLQSERSPLEKLLN